MNDLYLKIISLANNFQSYSAFSSALLWTILSFVIYNILSQLRPRYFTKSKRFIPIILALLLYFSLLYSIIQWFKFTLYIQSNPIDLNNIFKLNWLGLLVISLHIGIISLGWKIGLGAFEKILRFIPRQNARVLLYFIISTVITLPFYFSSLKISLPLLFLFSFSLHLLYDLYIEGKYSQVTWTLTWILFFTSFHTQLLYKFTLEREWTEMKRISEKLSTPSDKIIEKELNKLDNSDTKKNQLKELFIAWEKGLISNTERLTTLEAIFDFSPYLLSYYHLNYSSEAQLNHSLELDHNRWLTLTLKSDESNRLNHLNAGNFKGIDHLSDYSVSIFKENELLYKQGKPHSSAPEMIKNHTSFSIKKELTSKEMSYRLHKNGKTVILSKNLGGYAKPLAFFSLTACLSLIFYFIFSQFLRYKKSEGHISKPIKVDSLGLNIQKTLFYITFTSLCILSLASVFYFDKLKKRENEREYSYLAKEIISTLQRRYHGSNLPLASIAKQHGYDFVLTDEKGKKITSFSFHPPGGFKHNLPKRANFSYKKEKIFWKGKELLRVWFPVKNLGDKESKSMIGIYFPVDDNLQKIEAADFMGALFSGYLFLLLSISAITIYYSNSLTHPLDQLGRHLENLKMGESDKIDWHKNDEVGQLVNAYNVAIDELQQSYEKLRKTEREVAWREMAKQVAHEIKNPLTPMKLSLQYLQRAGKLQPDLIHTLLPKLTMTIMDQINTLDEIATSFSQFAAMPNPQNITFNLVDLLQQSLDMHKHHFDDNNDSFYCNIEADSYPIFADKNQMQRVINNLLMNAVQAIPTEKNGKISIRLFQMKNDLVRLEIEDNGEGVDIETQQKIFSPYFTTKSSGTGLGLAMCKDIIENAGGNIGFSSSPSMGACFWIEMPLKYSMPFCSAKMALAN
ncbi:MAG: ATP-binding protein [Saprospiraceae bacterium]|nr:ATP-binding protein [Saprospiraceae bacterium]